MKVISQETREIGGRPLLVSHVEYEDPPGSVSVELMGYAKRVAVTFPADGGQVAANISRETARLLAESILAVSAAP